MPDSPYDERDEETQRFTPTYSDEEFLTAIEDIRDRGDLPAAADIANVVGCSKRAALYRLNNLEASGIVRRRTAGDSVVWEVIDD